MSRTTSFESDSRRDPLVARQAQRQFLFALAALGTLVAIGFVGYWWIEGESPLDALYMAVTTLSPVGIAVQKPLSVPGKLLTMALIVAGGVVVAYAVATAVELFSSPWWHSSWQERLHMRAIDALSGHVIVCGYGRLGRHVVAELIEEKLPFVVIDRDPEKVTDIRARDGIALEGDASQEDLLQKAGIARARGLVACTDSDAENVLIVLTARNLRPDLVIVARANSEASEPKLKKAGANRVLFPFRTAGRRMVTLIVRPEVADFFEDVTRAGGRELVVEQLTVLDRSPLVGQTLREAQVRNRFNVTVLACRKADGDYFLHPRADTVLEANMQLVVLGTWEELQVLAELARGKAS
ncbi:potassium channel family protein [Candidatus Methylacidithermus pantelleriae]|uniref:Potassium channel protein n=1 Tax=Candidatus Methylacidithermus pantelleriae TaxID=2744239 RepID=A0A8J2FNN9_9BACT|nr:potassium channel protein [Candidatus Methylacidithermus pantelleriae]CAF0694035.1 Potassium channel protein [Candidatus Methylacidithermus pantelleriae]